MKVTIDRKDKETDKLFPKLMVSARTEYVVLFNGNGFGMIVAPRNREVGICHNGWDMDTFTDFTGTITLEND